MSEFGQKGGEKDLKAGRNRLPAPFPSIPQFLERLLLEFGPVQKSRNRLPAGWRLIQKFRNRGLAEWGWIPQWRNGLRLEWAPMAKWRNGVARALERVMNFGKGGMFLVPQLDCGTGLSPQLHRLTRAMEPSAAR